MSNNAKAHGRTRIKMCGITRVEDAELACELGVDAIGVIMAPASKRCVSIGRAQELRSVIGGLTDMVLLVVDATRDEVLNLIDAVRPDLVQYHGSESARFCDEIGWPYLKALSWQCDEVLRESYSRARGLVIDSHAPGEMGGSGSTFDWNRFPGNSSRPCLLAGGLDPDNVCRAVREVHPYGVDVASGLESAPGRKSHQAMNKFVSEVRRADTGSN